MVCELSFVCHFLNNCRDSTSSFRVEDHRHRSRKSFSFFWGGGQQSTISGFFFSNFVNTYIVLSFVLSSVFTSFFWIGGKCVSLATPLDLVFGRFRKLITCFTFVLLIFLHCYNSKS